MVKLLYKKKGFPSEKDRNRFLSLLADAGMMIHSMARLYYPTGIFPPDNTDELVWLQSQMKCEMVTLFEASFETHSRHIRVDILEKKGNKLEIVEIKSRGIDVEEMNGNPHRRKRAISKIRELIVDLAFQKLVIAQLYPECDISCSLILPDKNRVNPIDRLADRFKMERSIDSQGRIKIDAIYSGNPQEVKDANLLVKVNVSEEVNAVLHEVEAEAMKLEILLHQPELIEPEIGCHCRDCEFTLVNESYSKSGFETCWKTHAHTQPHILDLGQLGNVNSDGRVDDLIAQGFSSLNEVPEKWLEGKWGNRPWLQRTQMKAMMFSGFHKAVSDIIYPIFFIDFETIQPSIPQYKGMKPYQKILFQWSCHRMDSPNSEPVHFHWLHDTKEKPNPIFLAELIKILGNKGTIMTWSAYEQGVLNALKMEAETTAIQRDWIQKAVHRISDMNQLAMKYYFHPQTGGRTSIKVTLPAILQHPNSDRTFKWLKDLGVFELDEQGTIINPYKLLPTINLPGIEGSVNDGSAAMIAYHYLQLSLNDSHQKEFQAYRSSLLQYCELDTLAMLIIFEEWLLMEESEMPHSN